MILELAAIGSIACIIIIGSYIASKFDISGGLIVALITIWAILTVAGLFSHYYGI